MIDSCDHVLDEEVELDAQDPRGFVDVAAQFALMQTGVSMVRFLRDQAG
ncbi:hypothetical protein [Luteimonas panaciterrae]|nr:hypothetical protein [Luteimonas panaciterrae]